MLSISVYLAWIDKYFNIDKQYQHYDQVTTEYVGFNIIIQWPTHIEYKKKIHINFGD